MENLHQACVSHFAEKRGVQVVSQRFKNSNKHICLTVHWLLFKLVVQNPLGLLLISRSMESSSRVICLLHFCVVMIAFINLYVLLTCKNVFTFIVNLYFLYFCSHSCWLLDVLCSTDLVHEGTYRTTCSSSLVSPICLLSRWVSYGLVLNDS